MVERERASLWAGVVSVVVTNAAILSAALASPGFRWTGHALSNLGQPGHAVATPLTTLLFDGGLVVGGLLGLGFAYALWTGSGTVGKAAVPAFVAAMVAMAGIGVFPQSQPLHAPVAIGFYLLSMVTMALSGVGGVVAGERRYAAVTLALTALHVGVWYGWVTGGPVFRAGLAIPEAVGAAIVAGWIGLVATTHRLSLRPHTGESASGSGPRQ
ncbi:DUF998 domain-containing protein [Halomicroarcula sp. GCM10025709]|uniref:DUF998 domain-containing protein n=1 Tax=Haloarcula TaxID=2237 RepID=UPI0024C40624|nr:DUF998 domain-containing protein [Halomicroarcula sp. YJ-61-S]